MRRHNFLVSNTDAHKRLESYLHGGALRRGKSNSHGHTAIEPDTYGSCRTDKYSSAQANACTAARATYANAHCHGHAKSYPYTERYAQSNSAAPTFAGAAPVAFVDEEETHCSIRVFEPVRSDWFGSFFCGTCSGSISCHTATNAGSD